MQELIGLLRVFRGAKGLHDHGVNAILFRRKRTHIQIGLYRLIVVAERGIEHCQVGKENHPVLLFRRSVPAVGMFRILGKFSQLRQCVFKLAFIAIDQVQVEQDFRIVGNQLVRGFQCFAGLVEFHCAAIDLSQPQQSRSIIRIFLQYLLEYGSGFVKALVHEQGLSIAVRDVRIIGAQSERLS